MDTDTTNDTFIWSLTEIENDCSLCLRQIGVANNISGVVLPCCQQVVCEDCYKDELINKNNGSCPFCFFKGNSKGQKSSMPINNPAISINGVMNTVNTNNVATAPTISNGSTPGSNCLTSVGSGLPLDLSCWLPQNLTAICNPGYQSNSSTACVTSPYYKSNSTSAGDGFVQDNYIYMRGGSVPGATCGTNSINIGVGVPNMNISNAQQSPFGTLADGFWNQSHSSVPIQNGSANHNATGSSTNGSFISDPWMSTNGGYSPTNGFLHDFNSYDNINSNNINANMNNTNEGINDASLNIGHIKQCNSGTSTLLNNNQGTKFMSSSINMNDLRNTIVNNSEGCEIINDSTKDNPYQSNINVGTFNAGTPSMVNIPNNVSDIYQSNSMYTWTVQSPVICDTMNTFSQINNHNNIVSTTSVDVDFQRFCLGLGFDINNSQPNKDNTITSNSGHDMNIGDGNSKSVEDAAELSKNQDYNLSDKPEELQKEEEISVEDGMNEIYKNGSSPTTSKLENKDLPTGSTEDNHLLTVTEGNNSSSNKTSARDGINNIQLFNNSAFPPLTSAIIKQTPSSKDSTKASNMSNITANGNFNNGSTLTNQQISDSLNPISSPKISGLPGSNQNVNNNNPMTSSNPKLISMMGVRGEGSIRNNLNIGSAPVNNAKQNVNGSGKTGIVGNLNISAGNVSYVDAVLHKNDSNGGVAAASSSTGRSENQASVNSEVSNVSNDSSNNILSVNTDEDSSTAIGAHGEPYNYKRALCRHWMRGYCWLEADCKFAHGEAELRTRDGKLRHPTLSTGNPEASNQGQTQQPQPQPHYQSQGQVNTGNGGTVSAENLASVSAPFKTTNSAGSAISSNVQSKSLKQQSVSNKNGGNASYAATAASSLTSSVLNNDSSISYSVMVVSGANLDSKR
ncbi:HC-23 domain-containing protein [Cryptosporidium felis]|nr:HC-23 domain-containing protein [Cryptosporidium felis]